MDSRRTTRLIPATPAAPGAIAILQLIGDDCASILADLTGHGDWPLGRMRLVDLSGIDAGLAVRMSANIAHIMPHGGMRVVQRLTQELARLDVHSARENDVDPHLLFPEAADRFEALMLLTLSRAASPLAIDLLLDQPQRWREAKRAHRSPDPNDLRASLMLNRLIVPPSVALVGRPNVGKSTLSNALLGRTMSIAADVPGTTRDYVAGRIDLGGLVVDWHDTPGVRHDADAIESRAIDIANRLIESADLVIAMRDPDHDWPSLKGKPGLWIMNKSDDASHESAASDGLAPSTPVHISARHGHGVSDLVACVREKLVPESFLASPGLWVFDQRLLLEPEQ